MDELNFNKNLFKKTLLRRGYIPEQDLNNRRVYTTYKENTICVWNSIYCICIKNTNTSYHLIPLFEYYNIIRLVSLIKKTNTTINLDLSRVNKELTNINEYIGIF